MSAVLSACGTYRYRLTRSVCPDMAAAEAGNDLCDLVALYGAAA